AGGGRSRDALSQWSILALSGGSAETDGWLGVAKLVVETATVWPKRRRAVKPVAFEYYRPEAVSEALALLSEKGEEAAVLAGGMTLGPMLNLRVGRPRAVFDILRIQVLMTITDRSNIHENEHGEMKRH